MYEIAVVIPTYGRSDRLQQVVTNFQTMTRKGNLYFVIDPTDKPTKEVLAELQKHFIFQTLEVKGEYTEAVNYAYKHTTEPFLFLGADDIEFTPDWDKELLYTMRKNPEIGVTGGVDDWQVSLSKVHTSHPLVRRSYIEKFGGFMGGEGLVYHPSRIHYHLDIELEQTAWARGAFLLTPHCTIPHNHFVNHKAKNDATYDRSRLAFDKDTAHYNSRKHLFEFWDQDAMFQGKATPSKYRIKKLSVVMPIWNAESYVRSTLASLMDNTQHPYELIMIDDHSTEHDGKALLKELKQIASNRFQRVLTVANPEQHYTNHNWNLGVSMATGDYVAVINSDIDFLTPDWDDYLIENIDLGYELVNPFQLDRIYNHPYMKPPQEDALFRLNIRGACFMLSRELIRKAFPIPKEFTHWCGDNWISSKAKNYLYDIRVEIYHHISKSGEKVDQRKFWRMVYNDVVNYQKMTGDDLSSIEENCKRHL